jgi:GntR family transcriptional regulator, transcriptional repressor for pyruvate dehydrogenase complex
MTVIDAHHHVWDLTVRDQPWIAGPDMAVIRRTFTVDDLRPLARAAGVGATVLVQTVTVAAETPDVRQGDGTYATSLAPSLLLEALSFIIDFHRDDTVLEFFEVRRILEPAATGLAAVRMPAEEKAELGKILDAVAAESPVDDFVATDLEFHKKIALGAGNSVLASLVDNMSLPTVRARVWRGMTEPRAQERTLAEHRAIHSAILSGDAGLARSWATVHIGGIESWLRTTLAD